MLYKYLHNILNFACWPIKPKIFTSWPFKKVFVDPWYRTVPGTWWVLSEYKLLFTVLFSTLCYFIPNYTLMLCELIAEAEEKDPSLSGILHTAWFVVS